MIFEPSSTSAFRSSSIYSVTPANVSIYKTTTSLTRNTIRAASKMPRWRRMKSAVEYTCYQCLGKGTPFDFTLHSTSASHPPFMRLPLQGQVVPSRLCRVRLGGDSPYYRIKQIDCKSERCLECLRRGLQNYLGPIVSYGLAIGIFAFEVIAPHHEVAGQGRWSAIIGRRLL